MECVPSAGDRPESLDRRRLFSSLRRPTISSGFRFMMSFIEVIHSSALESLSLTIVSTYESDRPIARALTAQISSKRGWGSSLRSVTIDQSGCNAGLDGPPGSNLPYFLSIEDLLVFSHPQHELAIGWPDLVEFYFSAPRDPVAGFFGAPSTLSPPQPRSPVDLGSLDTTELPVLDDTLTTLSSRPMRSTCVRISVDAISSPAANPNAAAEFLAAVFHRRDIKIILTASFCWRYPYKSSVSNPALATVHPFVLCISYVFRCDGAASEGRKTAGFSLQSPRMKLSGRLL
ncbi:hypothetical protein EDB19DRAFT_1909480 [Suillus lakei]|nr:hypothetical protein EDB19DRAFT_1909480 [Suillus lakei]